MKPVKTDYSNALYRKKGCYDLPGTAYRCDDGTPGVETCWELSPEELEVVKKTGRIYLYTLGEGIPPMLLTVESDLIIKEKNNENS